jgi:Importin beta binding domain
MAERYIPEHRRTQFKAKNSFKPDELRRRREEQQVETEEGGEPCKETWGAARQRTDWHRQYYRS